MEGRSGPVGASFKFVAASMSHGRSMIDSTSSGEGIRNGTKSIIGWVVEEQGQELAADRAAASTAFPVRHSIGSHTEPAVVSEQLASPNIHRLGQRLGN